MHGLDFAPEASIPAHAGDTLDFAYRSSSPGWIQFWYQEDTAVPAPIESIALQEPWPIATGWSTAPSRLILEGVWKSQVVWAIWSVSRPLKSEEVGRLLKGGTIEGAGALKFRLSGNP
ncbi:MAG: hypothetical protein ABI036_10360 [Fibrobacteria bacterium]